jgi:hypothetical protein
MTVRKKMDVGVYLDGSLVLSGRSGCATKDIGDLGLRGMGFWRSINQISDPLK